MGIAMEMPSGILCRAMDIAKIKPSFRSILEETNVVIPSGILCKIKANTEIIPSLYNLLFVIILSIFWSNIIEKIIPVVIKILSIIIAGNNLIFDENKFNDSGIKEINDIVIITPAEKAREDVIIFSLLLLLSRQGITPRSVENPARVVIR